MNTLSKEKIFNYDSKELLGVIRFDFYDGGLSNQWNSRNQIIKLNYRKEIDLKKLQEELDYIQFTLIKDFNKVVELCNGTGYDKEILVYIELESGKYVVKLIRVIDSYSYIYIYKKIGGESHGCYNSNKSSWNNINNYSNFCRSNN
ncbi:MAG: hypothetical protein ACLUDK_14295 [Clostridium paraputrificum]